MRNETCICGSIEFSFDTELSDVSFCHCSICRRITGSAFGAYFEVPNARLSISDKQSLLAEYGVTPRLTKSFCRRCGSNLFSRHADFPGFTYVSLGALADDKDIRPEYHEYVSSKASWHEIGDSLPQFADSSEAEE